VGILLSKPGDAAEKAGAADKSRPATMASALVAIAPDRPVAVVDGKAITAAELDEMVGSKLFNIRQQEYQLRRQALDEAITKRLLEQEAAARKISTDELSRIEIEGKAAPVTEAEKKDFYEKNKPRFGQKPEAEALQQIEAGLRQQKQRERRATFVKELRDKAGVKVMLEPPRVTVAAGDNPAKGPANAPVTLIEFSDFQCPYCARVTPTLKRLQEAYPDKLRIVFRDLPLAMHKNAQIAAEAAACANEQGKFWEMHDRLFANQAKLEAADLKQHAVDLALDATAFNKCFDAGKYKANIKRDAEEAGRLGLSGTPAFFINGRLLVGAQPYESFVQVIDEELELASRQKGS
jgi:protein-disulfide isomerase